MVELLPLHPKVEGSSSATAAGIRREKMANKLLKLLRGIINASSSYG
jgi:hypothetical protein